MDNRIVIMGLEGMKRGAEEKKPINDFGVPCLERVGEEVEAEMAEDKCADQEKKGDADLSFLIGDQS
jgi:hypothetical protein